MAAITVLNTAFTTLGTAADAPPCTEAVLDGVGVSLAG